MIEEVARLYGYQNLTEIPPLARVAMLERPEAKLDRHELRKKMAGLGFQELINYSFISEEAEADFAEVKAVSYTHLAPVKSIRMWSETSD